MPTEAPPYKTWISWILAVLLAAVFFAAGGMKLAHAPDQVEHFAKWGYPAWTLYIVGIIELSGAVLVLVPKTRRHGAGLLACTMLGASLTHMRSSEWQMLPLPLVLLALSFYLGWINRPAP